MFEENYFKALRVLSFGLLFTACYDHANEYITILDEYNSTRGTYKQIDAK